MREIKFRAWVEMNTGGYMFVPQRMHLLDGEFTATDPKSSFMSKNVMQFTGLLDKNGREIYEGDILTARSHWGGPDSVLPKVKVPFIESDFVVEWSEDRWSLKDINFKERGGFNRTYGDWYRYPAMLPTDDYYRERYQPAVIGNIYENPELATA